MSEASQPAAPRARTLGCEIDGFVHDLLLVGDAIYVVRLGKARRQRIDRGGALRLLQWISVVYSRIGVRGLPTGHPDSSPDGTGAEVARARLRVAAASERQLLGLDPGNLRADASTLKARRTTDDEVVELDGAFAAARDAAGRRRSLSVRLAGDPPSSLERLLGLAGVHIG